MIPRILLLVALLALAVLLLGPGEPDDALRPAGAPEPPRYYLRDATVTEFGADGQVSLELAADRAVEDPDAGRVLLERVVLDYVAEPARRWHVTADRGALDREATTFELEGNVRLAGDGEAPGSTAVLRSQRLSFDSLAQVATTSEDVELDFGRHVLRARGLRADLKGETLRLESAVNGRFNP